MFRLVAIVGLVVALLVTRVWAGQQSSGTLSFSGSSSWIIPSTTPSKYGWAVVYRGQVCNQNPIFFINSSSTASSSSSSSSSLQPCSYGTIEGEKTQWFATKEEAFHFINGRPDVDEITGARISYDLMPSDYAYTPIAPDKIIGVFHVEKISIEQHQIGTHKESVQRTDLIDIPTMQWREKP